MSHGRENNNPLFVIGLLGGIGSGKSTVASILEKLGAARIDCDEIVHVLYRDVEVVDMIAEEFGDRVRGEDGIDRAELARVALASEESIQKLMKMIHPLVVKEVGKKLKYFSSKGQSLAVIEAAFLVESGLSGMCDAIWFINADAADCENRTVSGRGWKKGEAGKRELFQMPPSEKRGHADVVIENRSTLAELEAIVEKRIKPVLEKSSNPTD